MSLFKCPHCGGNKMVTLDSRKSKKANTVRRRRQCLSCNYKLSTIEVIVSDCLAGIKKKASA